ncbi:MAG TPA: hypothetical protein VKU41_27630 [Polyangiaceae bacterium]|nr:hypothetical protein [Polyangiaceae bacterium]
MIIRVRALVVAAAFTFGCAHQQAKRETHVALASAGSTALPEREASRGHADIGMCLVAPVDPPPCADPAPVRHGRK